ncbi:periplasmic glucan biosynthesis protein MdoG [Methylocella silvestris BL2]|uniref:Periplasmic glucan biosynthesis protein MdoG n=1 Tax=Methylocella silvestris (strain DSM 15510 / CIP 108128 / LMG 27833 / NCIMB 13906 / BL2) TaxID=395965 RepID=B8EP93_METSB|nr:glucan biosynthesis protein D [Methylocella silvestris]ACK49681.1 periplasmic glucan biosynthesis protein MdoG [Methylocella silvestris BL2]
MVDRREVLQFAIGLVAGPAAARADEAANPQASPAPPPAPSAAAAPPEPAWGFPLAEPTPFNPAMVTELARSLAKQPYKALAADLPDAFKGLSYDQYVAIHLRPGGTIWAKDNVGFALEPLHRGFAFSPPMQIHIVADGAARRVIYDAAQFDFGKPAPANLGDIGFSGFRVLAPLEHGGFFELATFQGASFFRAVGHGQEPGTMARALSIKTADPAGEEFPAIRTVWIERPTLAGNALTVYAIIDSESVTGAYRFTLRPGDATIIDTECTLFARAALDNFGIATMSATHVAGAIDKTRLDDLRPQIGEIDGLQILTGRGEWLWRPVSNPATLQISSFIDENPRGFGFLQRDRNFDHFQDDDQHWENRPSLWIEPIGDWAAGAVQLIEIPSESEVNDNIIAYWRPKQPLNVGAEISFAYRQFWCRVPPERPPLATVALSRSGRGGSARRRRFLVEFSGGALSQIKDASDIAAKLNVAPGSFFLLRTLLSTESASFRVLFELDPGNEAYSELRLVLESQGKPISETWIYRWTA